MRAPSVDPGETSASGLLNASVLPSAARMASALAKLPFGTLSRGPHTRCLRFAGEVALRDARLAFDWWPAFVEWD